MSKQNRMEILDSVKRCICGDRDERYGEPEENFERIADYWNIYLKHNLTNSDRCVSGHDVAIMMALFKIARIESASMSGETHTDSWLDAIGYLACGLDNENPHVFGEDIQESIKSSDSSRTLCFDKGISTL